MLESYNAVKEMEYNKLSAEEQASRGILGRLVGVIADMKKPTRNNRFYSEKLWEKFFNDPLTEEKIKEKVFVGEFGHPEDRTEVDPLKIAICMAEMPKKGSDGKIHGVFDILDTPCGKILKTLCDYGSHIGVSSRGTGDTYEDIDGSESVDPSTFEGECWDAVLVPAVKEARLKYVTESLNKKSLKQALRESVESASSDDRRVMIEKLEELNIDINDSKSVDNIDEDGKENSGSNANVAGDDVMAATVNELQESLSNNEKLKDQIISLQEQLSVCYAKETKLSEEVSRYKSAVVTLSESKKAEESLKEEMKSLTEELNDKENKIKFLIEQKRKLMEHINEQKSSVQRIQESLDKKKESAYELRCKLNEVEKEKNSLRESFNSEKKSLMESIEDMKKNSNIKSKEYESKISKLQEKYENENKKQTELVEQYKRVARTAVNKYISMKALHLGVSDSEIKNKLPENYSFADIDKICESVERHVVNVSKLPFNLTKAKVRITEQNNSPIQREANIIASDDDIDESFVQQFIK